MKNNIELKIIPIVKIGYESWSELSPDDFIAISSLSFSSFIKVMKIPKKTPNDILIESQAGILKIDNVKKSKIDPPFSKINFIDLKDWLTQTSPIITKNDINVFNINILKMYLKIRMM